MDGSPGMTIPSKVRDTCTQVTNIETDDGTGVETGSPAGQGALAGPNGVGSTRVREVTSGTAHCDGGRRPNGTVVKGDLHTLIYLSCGYEALERDTRALLACGAWEVASVEAFLFFPGTDSLETLVVFRRVDLGLQP
jgi:hypothetical protein